MDARKEAEGFIKSAGIESPESGLINYSVGVAIAYALLDCADKLDCQTKKLEEIRQVLVQLR